MRSGQTSVQQLLLFDPGNTEVPGEPAAVVVDSEAVRRRPVDNQCEPSGSPYRAPDTSPGRCDDPHGPPDHRHAPSGQSHGLSDHNPSSASPAATSQPAPSGPADRSPSVMFVRHPRARRYLIRVRTDGSVRVTIPRRGSKRAAIDFYERQHEWIARQQERVARARQAIPVDIPEEQQRTYRARARRELPARLLELASAVGLQVRKVSIRNQRQRWGSCSTSGLICLNWRLITMPAWVRDYVIYHELMHLKRMDHSPAFWKLVAQVCPGYRDARRWLRRHALAPHSPEAHADAAATLS